MAENSGDPMMLDPNALIATSGQDVSSIVTTTADDQSDIVSQAFTSVEQDGQNVQYVTMTPEEAAAHGVIEQEEDQVVTTSLQFDPSNPSVLYTADGTLINRSDLSPDEQALVQAALQQHLAEQEAEQQLAAIDQEGAANNQGIEMRADATTEADITDSVTTNSVTTSGVNLASPNTNAAQIVQTLANNVRRQQEYAKAQTLLNQARVTEKPPLPQGYRYEEKIVIRQGQPHVMKMPVKKAPPKKMPELPAALQNLMPKVDIGKDGNQVIRIHQSQITAEQLKSLQENPNVRLVFRPPSSSRRGMRDGGRPYTGKKRGRPRKVPYPNEPVSPSKFDGSPPTSTTSRYGRQSKTPYYSKDYFTNSENGDVQEDYERNSETFNSPYPYNTSSRGRRGRGRGRGMDKGGSYRRSGHYSSRTDMMREQQLNDEELEATQRLSLVPPKPTLSSVEQAISTRRKNRLKELLDNCTEDDIMEVTLPHLARVFSLWEFLVMKVEKIKSGRVYFADVYKEYESIHKYVSRLTEKYHETRKEEENLKLFAAANEAAITEEAVEQSVAGLLDSVVASAQIEAAAAMQQETIVKLEDDNMELAHQLQSEPASTEQKTSEEVSSETKQSEEQKPEESKVEEDKSKEDTVSGESKSKKRKSEESKSDEENSDEPKSKEKKTEETCSEEKNKLEEKTKSEEEKSDKPKSEDQKLEEQKPEDEKSEEQKSGEQKPEDEKSEEQKSEEQKSEEQKSEEQKSEEQKSEEQKSEKQKSEEQKSEEQKSEEQNSEEQKSKEQKSDEQKSEDQKPEENNSKEDKKSQEQKADDLTSQEQKANGDKVEEKKSEDATEQKLPESNSQEKPKIEEKKKTNVFTIKYRKLAESLGLCSVNETEMPDMEIELIDAKIPANIEFDNLIGVNKDASVAHNAIVDHNMVVSSSNNNQQAVTSGLTNVVGGAASTQLIQVPTDVTDMQVDGMQQSVSLMTSAPMKSEEPSIVDNITSSMINAVDPQQTTTVTTDTNNQQQLTTSTQQQVTVTNTTTVVDNTASATTSSTTTTTGEAMQVDPAAPTVISGETTIEASENGTAIVPASTNGSQIIQIGTGEDRQFIEVPEGYTLIQTPNGLVMSQPGTTITQGEDGLLYVTNEDGTSAPLEGQTLDGGGQKSAPMETVESLLSLDNQQQ